MSDIKITRQDVEAFNRFAAAGGAAYDAVHQYADALRLDGDCSPCVCDRCDDRCGRCDNCSMWPTSHIQVCWARLQ